MKKKRDIRKELETYPVYKLENGVLTQIEPPDQWFYPWELHHFVKRQIFDRNPEEYSKIQKLILMKKQAHKEADAYHSKFKERHGVELEQVIYVR